MEHSIYCIISFSKGKGQVGSELEASVVNGVPKIVTKGNLKWDHPVNGSNW